MRGFAVQEKGDIEDFTSLLWFDALDVSSNDLSLSFNFGSGDDLRFLESEHLHKQQL